MLTNHCSSERGNHHIIVYETMMAEHGDAEVDFAFKVSMKCPECGAAGGMSILPPAAQ